MMMTINKKINDKNNSKLKTNEIINCEVKQSKMMFLFIFVLFQTTFIIDFIKFYFFNIWWWILFVDFCILLFMHCDYHAYFNSFILLCWFDDWKKWSKCLFSLFLSVFMFCFFSRVFIRRINNIKWKKKNKNVLFKNKHNFY